MNKRIKQKWITALKSGKYKQGELVLKRGDKFCCLGVLTDIYIKDKHKGWKRIRDSDRFEFDNEATYLPKSVMEWAGIKTFNGEYGKGCLATHNDNGKTFQEIAEIIEKNF